MAATLALLQRNPNLSGYDLDPGPLPHSTDRRRLREPGLAKLAQHRTGHGDQQAAPGLRVAQ